MIRIAHTACVALLVTVLLIAYGVKEETRALRRQVESLGERKQTVEAQIATLEAEWSHLNSPGELKRIADRLYGEGAMRDVEGVELAPLGPTQILDLSRPPQGDPLEGAPVAAGDPDAIMATGDIRPADAAQNEANANQRSAEQ